ncbi:hypothetical protein [Aliivibrio logei]|uniref:hypothetical protein n=1 Tax=Aliivibrio logei TaxID=688 RepID=UPI0035C8D183
MNQYRYLVEDVKNALSDMDKAAAYAIIKQSQEALSKFSTAKVEFLQNKAILAAESMSFCIKQQYRFHQQGYPSLSVDYLSLLQTQLASFLSVFIALHRISPAFVYCIYDEFPEVLAWLCLDESLKQEDKKTTLIGLSIIDDLDDSLGIGLLLRSNTSGLDKILARLVEGKSKASEGYVRCLVLRQRVSVSLIKHWLSMSFLPEDYLHSQLALSNVDSSIEWLDQGRSYDLILFEQLVLKEDRSTWFRQQYSPDSLPSEEIATYAMLLNLKEFSEFDIQHAHAPFHLMLSGETALVADIVSYMNSLDEIEGMPWCEALFTVYGERLPLLPSAIGSRMDWDHALSLFNQWINEEKHDSHYPLRLGQRLSFDSSIEALKSPEISANFRTWLWREVCILSRVHFHWHPQLSVQQQSRLLDNISHIDLVRERFNLRGKHAALGY